MREIEELAAAIKAVLDKISDAVKDTDFEVTGTVRSRRLGNLIYRIEHKAEGKK